MKEAFPHVLQKEKKTKTKAPNPKEQTDKQNLLKWNETLATSPKLNRRYEGRLRGRVAVGGKQMDFKELYDLS